MLTVIRERLYDHFGKKNSYRMVTFISIWEYLKNADFQFLPNISQHSKPMGGYPPPNLKSVTGQGVSIKTPK